MEYKDYYAILGVPKNADEKTIKSAYRKLARTHHPDVNPDKPEAEQRFKEINEAYAVLSDGEKRKMYDKFGAEWEDYQRAGFGPNDAPRRSAPGGMRGSTRTMTPEEFQEVFGRGFGQRPSGGFSTSFGDSGGFSDFFEAMFGGASAGGMPGSTGARNSLRPRKGRDVDAAIEVSLEEAFSGSVRALEWEGGRRIEVTVPRGVRTGSRVRVSGQGEPGGSGGQAGDLYLNVTVAPHPLFKREGDDLRVTVPVDLYSAVLGGEVRVPTLERSVLLTVPAGTQNGRAIRLRGLGMPNLRNPEQRGDLFAVMDVQIPTAINDEQRRLFEELRTLAGN